jgi:ParB family chromosome partitioning protein
MAQEVGKSRSHIANTLRLLTLPEGVKVLLRDGKLTAGHARNLVGRPDAEALANEIVAGALNVREVEQRSQTHKSSKARAKQEDPNIKAMDESLSNALGLKVQVIHKDSKGGEVRIAYKTLEQLDDVVRRLKSGR